MQWIGWLLRNSNRRLEVSTGGKWFLLFTLLLGVVAINSGNNVIYLLESLLLSSLIFSGILSELTLSRLSFSRLQCQAVAGKPTADILVLANRGWLPLFCVEVGEWSEGTFHSIAFVLQIPGRGEVRVRSDQQLPRRGRHTWESLALGTSFPFGFARKVRFIGAGGDRIVWPSFLEGLPPIVPRGRGEFELSEGEVEETQPWEDVGRVHWPSSAKVGRLMSRPRRHSIDHEIVTLQLTHEKLEKERRISEASTRLQEGASVLLIQSASGTTRVEGAWKSLDALALLPWERDA